MKYSVSLGNFETLIIRNSAAGKEEEVKIMGSDLQKLTLCDSLICYVLAVNYQQAKAFAPQLHSDCDVIVRETSLRNFIYRVYSTYCS